MTLDEAMAALATKASESTRRTLMRHGAKEPFFGVRIGDMKPLQKALKGDQALALELYETGNGDAQYLAGSIADGRRMTRAQLQRWAEKASWQMISTTTVPWVASEHADGFSLATKWIDARKPLIAASGWATLGAIVATVPDENLAMDELSQLLDRVRKTLPNAPDVVRYQMNNFIIAVGTYVAPLGKKAIETARKLGRVNVDLGDTACRVPDAESYILKSRRGAAVAPKRKTVRC